jgi:hypothetical protein
MRAGAVAWSSPPEAGARGGDGAGDAREAAGQHLATAALKPSGAFGEAEVEQADHGAGRTRGSRARIALEESVLEDHVCRSPTKRPTARSFCKARTRSIHLDAVEVTRTSSLVVCRLDVR